MPQPPRRTCLVLALTLSLGACIAGCSSPGQDRATRQSKAADEAAEALSAGGYRPAAENALALALQTWTVQGRSLPVSLAFPAGSAHELPLIVYLPGLGESAQAGARWRHAWARAGYAVLSLQPLEADERAWTSELAREADFKALARERQQASQVQARSEGIQAALAEARRRASAGDSLWQRVDFNAIGLAAYELGTQAVLAPQLPFAARASIAISPVTAGRQPPLQGRPATPLLLISSQRDSDPTGLVDSPSRQARESFEQTASASAGDAAPQAPQLLLMLDGASHAALAGSGVVELEDMPDAGPGKGRGGSQGTEGQHGGGRHRGGGQGMPHESSADARGGQQRGASLAGQQSAALVEGISLAYWDATLRQRSQARDWLAHDADAWLQGQAVLHRR